MQRNRPEMRQLLRQTQHIRVCIANTGKHPTKKKCSRNCLLPTFDCDELSNKVQQLERK